MRFEHQVKGTDGLIDAVPEEVCRRVADRFDVQLEYGPQWHFMTRDCPDYDYGVGKSPAVKQVDKIK